MKKINYPKSRKKRILTNCMTYKLQNNFDWDEVVEYYIQFGSNKTGIKYKISSYVVRYVMELNKIKRPLPPHLLKAYRNGNWPPINRKMRANYV